MWDGFCTSCYLDAGESAPREAPPDVPVLEEGTVVLFDNKDHVWHGEVAVIRAVKHKFYRIELLGRHTLVPHEWVKRYEPG